MSAQRQNWVWIESALIHAVHDEQLAEHGGGAGLRDPNLLESALARPQQLAHYGSPDAADLAASYGYGISPNHPFIDGNKRTGFVALELFLALNGYDLSATDADCVLTMLSVAAGELEESAFANWIRTHSQPR
ncbi:MAG: type II toxin-antitoxin system death-on-curing family toxin [Gammaproteobacteria bacterium]|uniref:type II toxin-antitoxin system death-on-curing family toxin n=1 Tax=Rhodoferax sp. TaxID=50421 RepID=UPI0018320DFD|nr:type II toxin-antitoxin system death-on-curing family toxin [Rhodoferax sp.]MBU3897701.1 type II toxin-antitoxin system death-on-curing family toxin [Gammaproteobacteria bacterium]MBA3057793.1 type II toxin-antitoxin system death-on-curing family toxin [Rhodoferax sp.]MBU3998804.1 type II toxin-antitoxin system death-on-curing family toxin [Gammaproteobacteria bacterium]MBU4081544.1 type II toxin-antitoxin system death-on-curing family toxin [Gammaproteobacteria bacterium]MBU4114061.1 type 